MNTTALTIKVETSQLRDAWAAWDAEDQPADPQDSAFEIASLAGLLERADVESEYTERARRERKTLSAEIPDFCMKPAINRLANFAEDEEPEIVDEVLFDLDETGAAATFLCRTAEVADEFAIAAGLVRGFPEVFAARATLAANLLTTRPPKPYDPSLSVWRAVAAAKKEEKNDDGN